MEIARLSSRRVSRSHMNEDIGPRTYLVMRRLPTRFNVSILIFFSALCLMVAANGSGSIELKNEAALIGFVAIASA